MGVTKIPVSPSHPKLCAWAEIPRMHTNTAPARIDTNCAINSDLREIFAFVLRFIYFSFENWAALLPGE
jgi:hypothetical protein